MSNWHYINIGSDNSLVPNIWQAFIYPIVTQCIAAYQDDVIKWKHFASYWPFVRGIHRSPVNSPHKGQWHGALMFSLIFAWINVWVNNGEAGDLRHHRAHYDVIVISHGLDIVAGLLFDVSANLLLLTIKEVKVIQYHWCIILSPEHYRLPETAKYRMNRYTQDVVIKMVGPNWNMAKYRGYRV